MEGGDERVEESGDGGRRRALRWRASTSAAMEGRGVAAGGSSEEVQEVLQMRFAVCIMWREVLL